MSHCSGEKVSASLAGTFVGSAGPSTAVSGTCVAYAAVPLTFPTPFSPSMLVRNVALSERAIATPICL